MTSRRLSKRHVGIAVLALVVGSAAFGFAASNTVPDGGAGDRAGAISGYDVTNVAYGLNAGSPANIDSVSFDLDASAPGVADAATVKVQLVSSGAWYTCAAGTAPRWSCATTSPQATVLAATELRVVAVE